ncbi:hypothetical protein MKX03_001693 [Papaver bracteatum]|nr:hypothetical protein MKX03_001693 [Papaver bracteatum]
MNSEDEYKSVDSDLFQTFDDDDGDYSDCIDSEDEGDSSDDGIAFDVEEDVEVGDLDEPDRDRHEKRYTVLVEEDIQYQLPSCYDTTTGMLKKHMKHEVVPVQYTENIIKCGICFDEFPRDDMRAASCGHLFCNLCWRQYVSIKISDGAGCLMLRCPEPSCVVAVGQDMVNELVSDEDKEKNSRHLYRSYIEDRRKTSKWCPAPGCEFAIEFDTGSSSYDVVCGCGHSFCWNCLDDAHRPVDCNTVHKWAVKNTAESENLTWILANSKSCPKCKKPIEKNDGCMHMKCPCGFHFCWLCLGDWSIHGKRTGGYLWCNIYEKAKAEGLYDEEENLKEKAKNYLDRYAFYFERFVENQKSRVKAVESLKKMQSQDSEKLVSKYGLSDMELLVITDAWLQIIDCRRVLKCTYPYGYYLPQTEHVKKQFFEYVQGEAESALERLHQCAEQELQTYLEEDDSPEEFKLFHTKLFELTKTTRNYFENLVRALENGLIDVNSHDNGVCSRKKWLNFSEEGIEGRGGTSMNEYLSCNSDVEEEFDDGDCDDDHIDFDDEEDGELEIDDEEGREFEIDDDSDEEICYTILKEEDVFKRQEEFITQTSTSLSIPTESATILLLYNNWDVDKAQDAWFADEDKVRKDVGLQEVVPIHNTENINKCTICFDEFGRDGMCATTCGHLFCNMCWAQYVSIKIIDGPGCIRLRCPEPSCGVAVGQDMINELVSDEDKEKYSRYLLTSYIEDQKNIKWCPSPDCEYAVEFVAGSSCFDVVCGSDHSFCWNCLDDAHRPVDCDTVHKWAVQNTAESENVTWILANSKNCPSCKKPIQKNEGCMHMACRCGFHFCWLCLGDWKNHGERTGGFYACNVYEKAKSEGRYKEEDKLKKEAKDYLDRYTFHYERFAENQKSRLKAVESLQKMQSEDLAKLLDRYAESELSLEFITDAWLQIIECRRVLKWTYAYGYYLPQNEHAKKHFFEDLQGQAQSRLERLHQCAEQELQPYLKDDLPGDFNSFRIKLLEQTNPTRTLFENLVRALENGLSEVDSETAARQPAHFKESCQSKSKSGKKRK